MVSGHRAVYQILTSGKSPDGLSSKGWRLPLRCRSRQALTNLREVLGVLRSSDPVRGQQPTLADLDRLLDQSRALGSVVSRHDEGEARPLAPTAERTAYRVVQEALTNVHKHAGGAETEVHLRYRATELEVLVRNRPSTADGGLPGSGWGLVGLRERVELVGGRLEAGPRAQGGFQVLAGIPTA
ncbi:sensor histidine kinase [Streptosporangium sp. NPDC049376]|uniref:sensor histidine kinase n=1 Tax=Streptosporangium sp. NPDC049376 TaxID=3366192 RepID=UPI00378CD435